MEKHIYRERVYKKYISGRNKKLAPENIEDLKSREFYIRKLISDHFPKNKDSKILDLGCGYGAIIHFAHKLGYKNISGVDGSSEQVEAAQRLGIEGVRSGDLFQTLINLTGSSYDCLICFDVIEHFNRNELIELIDQVYRVLKPGGRWIIHTPNGESPFFGRIMYGDLTHELAFTRTSIAQLLLSSGFTKVKSFEDQPIPHGVKSSFRWFLWKIIRSILRFYIAVETGDTAKDAIFSQNFLTVVEKKN